MQTKQNWLSTAINYHFTQTGMNTLIQQHFANVIAAPSDEQILAVGNALANLNDNLHLESAEITTRSTILSNN